MVPLFKVIVYLWYIINTIKSISHSGCVSSLKWMLARFFSKFWKHGANSCKLPWQMCFRTDKVCPDSLIVTSNISLLVPQERWVEMSGREIAPELCQPAGFLISTCDFGSGLLWCSAPAIWPWHFWSCELWKDLRARYPLPANAWCGISGFMQTPQPLSGSKKKKKMLYWAQKVAARLSSAQVSGNGISPNSKQAYLLSQEHRGARGINMQ